jgi:hypothetical protein
MAWKSESKRHSIARKYGRAGSKKTSLSKMSSLDRKTAEAEFSSQIEGLLPTDDEIRHLADKSGISYERAKQIVKETTIASDRDVRRNANLAFDSTLDFVQDMFDDGRHRISDKKFLAIFGENFEEELDNEGFIPSIEQINDAEKRAKEKLSKFNLRFRADNGLELKGR